MKGHWFRMYDRVVDDPKVQRLSDGAFRAWVNLLCIASRGDGVISGEIADLSFSLRRTQERTRAMLSVLIGAGLIERCDDHYRPQDWAVLQYKSDVSSDRVKRFRTRLRNGGETGDETSPEQNREEQSREEQSREEQNREEQNRAEPDLPSDPRSADADDDGDDFSGRRKKARKTYPEAFEVFWREYPTDPIMSKIRAFEKWRALGEDDRAAAHAALAPFRAHCRRNPTYHPVHAERFLSQRRFDGFTVPVRGGDDALASLWGGAAAPLVAEIGAGAFQAYFGEAVFDPGPPARIKIARQVTRDLAREKFTAALKRAVGEFELCG